MLLSKCEANAEVSLCYNCKKYHCEYCGDVKMCEECDDYEKMFCTECSRDCVTCQTRRCIDCSNPILTCEDHECGQEYCGRYNCEGHYCNLCGKNFCEGRSNSSTECGEFFAITIVEDVNFAGMASVWNIPFLKTDGF